MANPSPAARQTFLSSVRTWAQRASLRRVLVAAALVALAAFAFRATLFGPAVDAFDVTRADLVQSVVSSGRIVSPQRISVASVLTAAVVRIPVDEGQTVRRGDILIVLDDKDARAAVAQAQAAVAQAEAKLRQLREVALPAARHALAQAEANLLLARQQYERAQNLLAKGFVSQSALDDAKRNLDVSESQLRAARLQVETNENTGSDYLVALAAREQAAANLAMANARLDQTVIRAPVDGTLIGRDVEPGNVVQPGKELMALAPAGATQVIAQIDEKNLAQLKLGQKALGSADAYPHERFDAVLAYINPGIDALRGSVEVKLDVPHPPEYLRQDMTVSVDIEVGRRANAVIVPAETVNDAGGDAPWVMKVEGSRLVRAPVKLGLRGEGKVEVLSGVAPGDVVIVTAGTALAPGERVRATIVARNGK
jgi:HlyD family secretion protein